jgi:hypothetical protein
MQRDLQIIPAHTSTDTQILKRCVVVMAAPNLNELLLNTLNLLDWRLKRLEFILNGTNPLSQEEVSSQPPILRRIQKLEHSLQKLSSKNDTVANILRLRMWFSPLSNISIANYAEEQTQPQLFTRPTHTKQLTEPPTASQALTTVLSAAPTLQTTASQLRALSDLSPPPTSSFTQLIALWPRIEAAAQRQAEQELQVADLRKRSAGVVVRWHEIDVKGQMRCWVEWEGRVRKVEREVRRAEKRRVE